MKYTDLIISYSKGDINLDELNRELAKAKIPMKFDPMANTISADEIAQTRVSKDPYKCTGWGFMSHGIGTPNKMKIVNGYFEYDTGFGGVGNPPATFYIKGLTFDVVGDHIEVKHDEG